MVLPDRIPVADALGVVPHAVAPDPACARPLGYLEHPAIGAGRDAGDHLTWRRSQPLRPVAPYQLEVAADATARHQYGRPARFEAPDHLARALLAALHQRACQHGPVHADHAAVLNGQFVGTVAKGELHQSALGSLAHLALERLEDRGARAPGQMEARDRVAVRPARVRRRAPPIPGRAAHGCPSERSQSRFSIVANSTYARANSRGCLSSGRSNWALPSQSDQASSNESWIRARRCSGEFDEEQASERPERLPAEGSLRLLIDQQHALALGDQLCGRHQPCQATANHDRFGLQLRGGHAAAGYRPCG